MTADDELKELVDRYSGLISAAIRRVCAKRYDQLVPDVRQEVYLALWRQLDAGKNLERPASYVYKVALTTALATIRRLKREREIIAEAATIETRPDMSDADRNFARAQLLELALQRLDERQQRAVRAYLAGFNHTEVAGLLRISASAARHAIYRGIERLRDAMAQLENDADEQ